MGIQHEEIWKQKSFYIEVMLKFSFSLIPKNQHGSCKKGSAMAHIIDSCRFHGVSKEET
jgi:hypothetical protein